MAAAAKLSGFAELDAGEVDLVARQLRHVGQDDRDAALVGGGGKRAEHVHATVAVGGKDVRPAQGGDADEHGQTRAVAVPGRLAERMEDPVDARGFEIADQVEGAVARALFVVDRNAFELVVVAEAGDQLAGGTFERLELRVADQARIAGNLHHHVVETIGEAGRPGLGAGARHHGARRVRAVETIGPGGTRFRRENRQQRGAEYADGNHTHEPFIA